MKPTVSNKLDQMNGLQRAVESFRYVVLLTEGWISPNGQMRSWLRLNIRAGAWLLIPAVFVMPVITIIIWELGSWSLGIIGKLILILVLWKLIKR